MRLVLTGIVLILFAGGVNAAPPTDEEIAKAIKELGDRRFAVREKAAKFLWDAGRKAEPALRAALTNDDPETKRRAAQILDKFSWGIFPDTPKEVVEIIARFRDGDEGIRGEAISQLIRRGRQGLQTIQRLMLHATSDVERRNFQKLLAANAEHGIPALVRSGDLALCAETLELCLDEETFAPATNFAAVHHFAGTLPAAIEVWQKYFAGKKENTRAGVTLVHLYRASGDFAKARSVAEKLENNRLVEDLLWEEGSWQELMRFHDKSTVRDLSGRSLGARAAYARLAGDKPVYEKATTELRKASDATDPYQFFGVVEGMLLNGRGPEAVQLLLDRKIRVNVAFELMAAQSHYRDALKLVTTSPQEKFDLELNRARQLRLLGDKDTSLQLFQQIGARLQPATEATDFVRLLRAMVKLQLRVPALDAAAQFLPRIDKGQTDVLPEILDAVFGDAGDAALTWWQFFQRKDPKEDCARTLKRISDMFSGKAGADRAAAIAELTKKTVPTGLPIRDMAGEIQWMTEAAHLAAAAACRAANDDRQAELHLQKACDDSGGTRAPGIYADFLVEQKRWQEAAKWYANAAMRHPTNPMPHFLHGWALAQAGNVSEGRRIMEQSHVMPLGNEAVRMQFASDLGARGLHIDARRECDIVGKIGWYRDWPVGNVLNRIAVQAMKSREYALAADCIEKSMIGYMRNDLVTFLDASAYIRVPYSVQELRARAAIAAGKIDEGLRDLHSILDVLPGNIDLVIQAWPELNKVGRGKDAQSLFNRVFQRYVTLCKEFPDSALLHNSLAWLAAVCRRQLDDAITHAQHAVRLAPTYAGYIDTLAEAHFQKGEQQKAVELMKQCITMEPKRAYYRDQLARFEKGDPSVPVPDSEHDD
jgi:tetratricopeptide (TPR) repeat protein